jgi:hypothetical protein
MRAFLKSQNMDIDGWEESTTDYGEQEVLD